MACEEQSRRPDRVLYVPADEPVVAFEQQGRSPVCVVCPRRSESFIEQPLGAIVRVGRKDLQNRPGRFSVGGDQLTKSSDRSPQESVIEFVCRAVDGISM